MPFAHTAGAVTLVSSATSMSLPYPASISAGDLLVIVGRGNTVLSNMACTGFTAKDTAHFPFLYKTATGSESGSATLTWTTTASRMAAVIICLKAPAVYAVNESGTWYGVSDPLSITPSGVSSTGAILVCYSETSTVSWTTPPTGFTHCASSSALISLWVGYKENPGTTQFTMDASTALSAKTHRVEAYAPTTGGIFFGSNF